MTKQSDWKARIRARMAKTGESYAAARAAMLRGRPENAAATAAGEPETIEAVVLKINDGSARVRVLGESGELTVRVGGVGFERTAPGQIATLRLDRRWTWHGDPYASGTVHAVRTDLAKLGLEPLPVEDHGYDDPAEWAEPNGEEQPWSVLWDRWTGRPRRSFELHAIAWKGRAAFESNDPEDAPIAEASELRETGDEESAYSIVMDVLGDDLRCLDAHAHLGNWMLDRSPARAMVHYEIGVGIGELSLKGLGEDLMLPWAALYNRPFLRCLHGQGLAAWRLGRMDEAERVFARIYALNPNDNQGVRFCWHAVREGTRWEDFVEE